MTPGKPQLEHILQIWDQYSPKLSRLSKNKSGRNCRSQEKLKETWQLNVIGIQDGILEQKMNMI